MVKISKDIKRAFAMALANIIAILIETEKASDGSTLRMNELADALGISNSSASQRIRSTDPVPFTLFEGIRLMVFFRKPIFDIIPVKYCLTEKELSDKDLLMEIGYLNSQTPMVNQESQCISEEEENLLTDYRNCNDTEKQWIQQYFNLRKGND